MSVGYVELYVDTGIVSRSTDEWMCSALFELDQILGSQTGGLSHVIFPQVLLNGYVLFSNDGPLHRTSSHSGRASYYTYITRYSLWGLTF